MEEKKEHHTEHKTSKKVNFSKLNFWMISTIVLVLLLIGMLAQKTITTVSEDQAGKLLTDFAKSQGVDIAVKSVTTEGNLYKVTAQIQGQEAPFYVTKDGKFFTSNLVPLTATNTDSTPDTNTPAATTVPKSDKPVVELYVMSYCPYGTQMEKAILPVVSLLGDKIDFKIKWVSYAMHAQKEIDENLVQDCIQKEQPTKYLSYLQCFLGNSDTTTCQKEAAIDSAKLKTCVAATDKKYGITASFNDKSSWLSGQFPQFNIDKDDNIKYGVQGSPTLVINGVQSQSGRSPAAALSSVCAAFNEAPSECSTQLASDQASPGFGYGTSASDSSAAGCVV